MEIYIGKDGRVLGPYKPDEIQTRLDDAHFDGTELAWREGLDEWVNVLEFPEYLRVWGWGKTITDASLKDIAKLQKLTILALYDSEITDAGLKDIAKLQKLTALHLDVTKITDEGLKDIAKLQNLTDLTLYNTRITDAVLKDIAKLQNLTFLDLGYTKITDAGAAELWKMLPKCEIAHSYNKD